MVPANKEIAMTGEITLRGRVLPVGGIKEKSLAALRAKMKAVIMPERNKKDLEEIPKDIRDKIKFIPVKHMDEVLKIIFAKQKKKKPPQKKPGSRKQKPVRAALRRKAHIRP